MEGSGATRAESLRLVGESRDSRVSGIPRFGFGVSRFGPREEEFFAVVAVFVFLGSRPHRFEEV